MSYYSRRETNSEFVSRHMMQLTIGIVYGLFWDGLWGAGVITFTYFLLMGMCMLIGYACYILTWLIDKVTL